MSADFPSGLYTSKHPSRSRVWICSFAREVWVVSGGVHWPWLVLVLLGPGVARGVQMVSHLDVYVPTLGQSGLNV